MVEQRSRNFKNEALRGPLPDVLNIPIVGRSLRVEEPTRYELMGEVARTLEAPVVLRRHAAKARGDDHDEHIHTSMEAEADGMEYALVVEPRAVMITGEALGP